MGGVPRGVRSALADVCPRPAGAFDLRQHRAMPGAAAGQCRPAAKRRNAALAAQRLLDVAGDELHSVDDRTVRVDLLRSVPA